jgi:hypothetical protein
MKYFFNFILVIIIIPVLLCGKNDIVFDDYFINKTMRIDYFHIGDADEEIITIDQIYRQGVWAGNPDNLIDPFNNGRNFIKIYDLAANKLIFSKGYNCIFGEYRTTEPAIKGLKRTYHESVLTPYPKKPVLFVIEARDKKNVLHPVFIKKIYPDDIHIIKEQPGRGDKIYKIIKNGDPHKKVDVVFIAEGYTAEEENKFKTDLKKHTEILFGFEPYNKNKKKFNVYGIFSPSLESGIDQPTKGIYKNSAVNASFNALDIDRYLLTEDNKTLRDIAAQVPYDAILIMVNSKRYGGGGIYNNYAVFTAHNQWNDRVLIHEFGHSFAGLADEYYASSTSYNDFYPKGVEPTEPNITALLNPDKIKWKDILSNDIEIPTNWNKDVYDSLNLKKQKMQSELNDKIKQMKKDNASEKEIKDVKDKFDELSKKINKESNSFLIEHPLNKKIGAFEGAGYSSKGLYRPMINCLMFSLKENHFCKVCQDAITKVINYYSE